MTFVERLAALGVDLSDLPKRYRQERRSTAFDAADKFGGSLSMTQNFEDYILHLIDIIDRMETRLINLTGERDYLAERVHEVDPDLCDVCVYAAQPPDAPECEECYNRDPDHFQFAGVPMDWDADAHSADH